MSKLRGYAPNMTPIYQEDLDQREQQLAINLHLVSRFLNRAEKSSGPFAKAVHEVAAATAAATARDLDSQIKQLKEWIVRWTN